MVIIIVIDWLIELIWFHRSQPAEVEEKKHKRRQGKKCVIM